MEKRTFPFLPTPSKHRRSSSHGESRRYTRSTFQNAWLWKPVAFGAITSPTLIFRTSLQYSNSSLGVGPNSVIVPDWPTKNGTATTPNITTKPTAVSIRLMAGNPFRSSLVSHLQGLRTTSEQTAWRLSANILLVEASILNKPDFCSSYRSSFYICPARSLAENQTRNSGLTTALNQE
jgi:hypothetical protein